MKPIRNIESYIASMWNWHFLNRGCFDDTGIKLGDADGIVERNGYLLVIETKSDGVEVTKGQRILAEKASAFACGCGNQPGQVTVIILHGDPRKFHTSPFVHSVEVVHAGRSVVREFTDGTVGRQYLTQLVKRWFQAADSNTFKPAAGIAADSSPGSVPISAFRPRRRLAGAK